MVAPSGAVQDVGIYRESNGVPGLQLGADVLLASDSADPYTVAVLTAGLVAGTYVYYARAVTTTGVPSNVASTSVTVVPPGPPEMAGVIVNDGSAQRSRVTSLTVVFDQLVSFSGTAVQAFQLRRQSDSAPVTLAASVNYTGFATAVTLTFLGGALEFGSLQDGRYTLTVASGQVYNANDHLDGDGNGGGDNYVTPAAPGNPGRIHRLFGDADGDANVDAVDFGAFRLAFGSAANAALDFDGDGDVDALDFGRFRNRFGASV